MADRRRFPALDLWHDELRAGLREKTTFDALYSAACEEASAREFFGMDIPELGDSYMRRAAEIIAAAGPGFAKGAAA